MSPSNSPIDWNERFSVQAKWTRSIREFLINQLGITESSRVLEVGSGTGVVLRETRDIANCKLFGIDLDLKRLENSKQINTQEAINCADAYHLPFADNTFDFIMAHYFFLWLKTPLLVMFEVNRVLKQGGFLVAFAEPDYSARIEYPEEFQDLGIIQTDSLAKQGINPKCGRSLPLLFSQSNFEKVQYGLSGFQIPIEVISDDWDSEWEVIESDILGKISIEKLSELKLLDQQTRLAGSRVSWVPTFYAFGKKKKYDF
jgi:SAM-dependent methyltransferase